MKKDRQRAARAVVGLSDDRWSDTMRTSMKSVFVFVFQSAPRVGGYINGRRWLLLHGMPTRRSCFGEHESGFSLDKLTQR